ncbi:YdeI family protein [Parvularcula sp. IMCC14364]|uniref:YdeI/OmpD-associated family protein n=1 Tax=Parvularcula sp. IMCC14364 TaxID=3067902 RepID=UPI0035570CEA
MITNIEDYFSKGCGRCERFDTPDCSTKQWEPGLKALRQICTAAGLTETVKWGHPCYTHAGRNIAIIGAFRDNFRLSFFYAALMKDPDNILQKQGPNTQYADMIPFTQNEQVAKLKASISGYLLEAMQYAENNVRPEKIETELSLPDELVNALAADPELAEAFDALTPGRQKSYVINLNSAKKPETRYNRIGKFREKIISGKGAMER